MSATYIEFAICDDDGHAFDFDAATALPVTCSRCGRAVSAEEVRAHLVALGQAVPARVDAAINEEPAGGGG